MGFRTQRDVERLALPPNKTDAYFFDDGCQGLSVRLQGDRRTWVVWYAIGDRRRKVSLGDVIALSLRDARTKAATIVSGAKDGADPLADRAARAAKRAHDLAGLIDLYLARHAERHQRPKTLAETTRALRVHMAPLHAMPLDEIARRDVAARLHHLAEASGPIAANRVRAAMSGCFSWAMKQGLVDGNPVVGTAKPAPETKRDRVLTAKEVKAIWHAAGEDDYGQIVQLLILTGQRREEVGGIAWSEIDFEQALWTLPAARSKNRLAHDVPLVPAALALIGTPRPGRPNVFGRRGTGFSGWSQSKARLDERCGVAGWVLHDLRRTVITGMAELGTAPHVVEAVVNHISGHKAGVAGVYNRAEYRDDKLLALQRWADHVLKVVGQ